MGRSGGRRRRRQRSGCGWCGYCGRFDTVTIDEVPPRCLFASAVPRDIIEVPACDRCHDRQTSRDDEHFKLKLAIHVGAEHNPTARALWPSLIRSVTKPEAPGWAGYVFRTLRKRSVHSPAGLYLGTYPTYELDVRRLERVAERIMRGLYYKWSGNPVPWIHDAHVFASERLRLLPKETHDGLGLMLRLVTQAPAVTIGDRVFSYYLRPFPDDPAGMIVAFIFYEKAIAFLGWVCQREGGGDGVDDKQEARASA